MLVKEIINIANKMRPGNDFDSEIVERWIDECDASIQLNIALKKPDEIIRLRPSLWESDKNYKKGNVFVTLEPHLQTFDGLNALATKSFDNPYKYPNQQVAFLDAFGKLKELL